MKPNAFLDAIRSGNGSQDHGKMPATKAAQCTLTVEPTIGALAALAQEAPAPEAATKSSSETVVPRLIQFSGVVKDATGKVATGRVTVTFSHELQDGGLPLGSETDALTLDEQGRNTVLLGASSTQRSALRRVHHGPGALAGRSPNGRGRTATSVTRRCALRIEGGGC